jgi:hypothetical protein
MIVVRLTCSNPVNDSTMPPGGLAPDDSSLTP